MKIFNIKGWLIRLGDWESAQNRYLFFIDKPCFYGTAGVPDWSKPEGGFYLRSGWEDIDEAIHFELTEEESKKLGLPITEKYYYLEEDNELNYDEKDRFIKKDKRIPLPPYGRLIIDTNFLLTKIIWKPLKEGKNIRYLSRDIVKDKIEEIFQKYCFKHKEDGWILPRSYPEIIKDVKEELYSYMKKNNWLRKSYKFR